MRSTSPLVTAHLIVDEQVRDIIVMIFESCVSGMTTSEVAQMLNDMGIPSPLEHKRRNGGFYNGVVKEETGIWLKGAVRKILTDERYTGKMITNIRETEEVGKPKMRSLPRDQWIIVPGTHEAIISEELFRAAQNALQEQEYCRKPSQQSVCLWLLREETSKESSKGTTPCLPEK